MREKLLDLMKCEGLRPTQFAEMLEVNPAGISHILAGRNKPGFDLLQKILRRFPQVNPDWLLLDSDKMYRNQIDTNSIAPAAGQNSSAGKDLFGSVLPDSADENSIPKNATPQTESFGVSSLPPNLTGASNIKRIIVLYDDQTFESFTPTVF